MRGIGILLALAVTLGGATAAAQDGTRAGPGRARAAHPVLQTPDDMRWTALPERPGMRYSVLSGDPTRTAYTQIRRVPAGSSNPLHHHSNELKNVIISGTWYCGPEGAPPRNYGPGSVVLMPAGWHHVSGCRPGADCVFYQEGDGRFDFVPAAPTPRE